MCNLNYQANATYHNFTPHNVNTIKLTKFKLKDKDISSEINLIVDSSTSDSMCVHNY